MNRLLPAILVLVSFVAYAQDCPNPLAPAAFQTGFNMVAAQPTNQKKLERALEFIQQKCLTSAQVKNIAVLFSEDSYRLEFCRPAFQTTFDRVNFFDVYDAFTSFSNALRLYHYTQNPQQPVSQGLQVAPEPIKQMLTFPDIPYPSPAKYMGSKGCPGPIADGNSFGTFASQVAAQPTDEAKFVAIDEASQSNCYSMAQMMKLTSLITSEKVRLRTLTESFPRTFDQDNYPAARALFTSVDLQNQWVNAAKLELTPVVTAPPCTVEDAEVKTVVKTLQSKNFPDDKLNLLATINKSKCFNVSQITQIAGEFSFDKDKVSAMKMLYATCPDKENYYQLVDKIFIAHFQEELTQFIKNDGK